MLPTFLSIVLVAQSAFASPLVIVSPRFRPPVTAIIFDHFRPPPCAWCAGNRGIDYAVSPGTPVMAAGSGLVEFAGTVGRDLFVVVAHPDGLRTTYAFLSEVRVSRGQPVGTTDVVGLSGADLHFGVRRGATYLDPEPFLMARHMRARLVA